MPASTTRLTLPYPIASDPADVPADLLALAGALDPKTAIFVQGTAASRPAAGVAGRLHYATDTGQITYDTGTAWTAFAVSGSPPLVTSLPGSPADGQECYYQNSAMATAGILWHLRYRAGAAGSYKWEFLGGPPLESERVDNPATVTSSAFIDIGAAFVLPGLAGDYDIEVYSTMLATDALGAYGYLSYKVGATAADGADGIVNRASAASPGYKTLVKRRRKTALAASTSLQLQARTTAGNLSLNGGAAGYPYGLRVWPVRVG